MTDYLVKASMINKHNIPKLQVMEQRIIQTRTICAKSST